MDDYSYPIKFDTFDNDTRFDKIQYSNNLDILNHYDEFFQYADNILITGSTDTIIIDGPLIIGD